MTSAETSPATPASTVYMVDDDAQTCAIIGAKLREAGIACKTFDAADKFLSQFDPTSPGCLLLDIRMPGMTGPELQQVLNERHCRLPIIFLSAKADVRTAVDVLHRGAVDLIEKNADHGAIVAAVRKAFARDLTQRAEWAELTLLRRRARALTPREREVGDLLAQGKTNRQTALALGVSERTIEIHRARVMSKMECESIASFAVQWMKLQAANASEARAPAVPTAAGPSTAPLLR